MSATIPLAAEFPQMTEADWLAAVRKVVLKGKPDATDDEFRAAFERQLVHRTADGIAIQPLYTTGPAPDAFTRGTRTGPWEIRQRVWAGHPGSSAVTELESGATGVLVELSTAAAEARPEALAEALAEALKGVHLEIVPVSVETDDASPAGDLLVDLWDSRGTPLDQRAGTLGLDPIGAWARSGGRTDLAAAFAGLAGLTERLSAHPNRVRAYVADGPLWHEAGATPVQELAWNVAAAIATIRAVPAVNSRFELRWAVDADQFMSIAKLRAARQLWARVAELAALPGDRRAFHAAEASRAMLTRYDTWTNALRSTVACFAAGVGGAEAVTVWPHDAMVTPGGTPLGRRIARNTQTILQSESNLWRVLDMAGGAWYVESLTAQLADAAWAEIQRLESLGGFVAAVEGGHVHAALDTVLTDRAERLARRRQPLTGLSEFPNIDEPPPPVPPLPVPPPGPAEAPLADSPFPPFPLRRLSEGFEAQRARADQHERLTGVRPLVFLAQLGSLAEATTRTTFAKNLFESAGIRTLAGAPSAFAASGAVIACLCSSDTVYAEHGPAAAAELRDAGAERVLVAGRTLNLDGVDEEVGMGSDVLDVLTRTLDGLGVPR